MNSLLDLFVIAYEDPYNIWPEVKDKFNSLTRFDITLNRNAKLENLNNTILTSRSPDKLVLKKTVRCTYFSADGQSGSKAEQGEGRESAQESRPVMTRENSSEYPYLFLFLVPPMQIQQYKASLKPKLNDFIARRLENKVNEEFAIIAFVTHQDKKSNLKVVEKIKMKLFKLHMKSRLAVVHTNTVNRPVVTTLSENPVGTEGAKDKPESALPSKPREKPEGLDECDEKGLTKILRSLLNISINKRYLYILINANRSFMHFGNRDPGDDPFLLSRVTADPEVECKELVKYKDLVTTLENLSNIFQKLGLKIESIILYEFMIYNASFAKVLEYYRNLKIESAFFERFRVINNPNDYYLYFDTASEDSSYIDLRLYILSKQLLTLNTLGDSPEGPYTHENLLFLTVLLIYNFAKDVYFLIISYYNENTSWVDPVEGKRRIKWLMLILLELIRYIENKLNAATGNDADSAPESEPGAATPKAKRNTKKKFNRFVKSLFNPYGLPSSHSSSFSSSHQGRRRQGDRPEGGSDGADKPETTSPDTNLELVIKAYYNIRYNENVYKYFSFIYLLLYKLILNLQFFNNENYRTISYTDIDRMKLIDNAEEEAKFYEYLNGVYNSCILLCYNTLRSFEGPGGMEHAIIMRNINAELNNITAYKINVINKCSKYFILSNLHNYSYIFQSYYLANGCLNRIISPPPEPSEACADPEDEPSTSSKVPAKEKPAEEDQGEAVRDDFEVTVYNCHEYDHLYNKNTRVPKGREDSLHLYPNCYNYMHIMFTNNTGKAVESSLKITRNAAASEGEGGEESLSINFDELTMINIDNKITEVGYKALLERALTQNKPLQKDSVLLPKFSSKVTLCLPFKMVNHRDGIELSLSLCRVEDPSKEGEEPDRGGPLLSKRYRVLQRELFEVKMTGLTKTAKNIYLRVLYHDLIKIQQIYLNDNIIAGTTLLDQNSIYKIMYQSTKVKNPTEEKSTQGEDGGSSDKPKQDEIKVYYTLYRKYKSSLQQLINNQIYTIHPEKMHFVPVNPEFAPRDARSPDRSEDLLTADLNEDERVEVFVKIPFYGFVYKSITMNVYLMSKKNVHFSYCVNNDENWFVEGLVVNNNVLLTKNKRFSLFFNLIPLKEGNLKVPTISFKNINVSMPAKEITIFPQNQQLL